RVAKDRIVEKLQSLRGKVARDTEAWLLPIEPRFGRIGDCRAFFFRGVQYLLQGIVASLGCKSTRKRSSEDADVFAVMSLLQYMTDFSGAASEEAYESLTGPDFALTPRVIAFRRCVVAPVATRIDDEKD